MNKLSLTLALAIITLPTFAVEIYKYPSSKDSGTYFILSSNKGEGEIIDVLSGRIGKNDEYTDFTKLKVNCHSRQFYAFAGSSEEGLKMEPSKPLNDWSNSKWTTVVMGSSKSDLVNFVCRK